MYSFVPAEVAHFKNDPVGRMRELANEAGRENVDAVSANVVALAEVTQPADVLWLHLFYHDLHTALIQAKGATAADFNRAVHDQLKPGGSYVIVDHAATAGSGTNDTQSLHRIDPAVVRREVEAAGFVLDAFSGAPPAAAGPVPSPELEQLTPREREVLQLIARGHTYKEVARRLVISIKTVETHVSSVLRKLQLSSRHELARWATDHRLD